MLTLLIACAAASCDLGSALLTEDEIGGMYDIGILDGKAALIDGSAVEASRSLTVEVAALDGAPEPASLTVELLDADGDSIASVTYGPDPADGVADEFLSELAPFALPDDLEDGYYTLSAVLQDASGAELSSWSVTVLSLGEPLAPPVVAVFPGAVRAGGTAFLKLEWSVPEGLDPWIRWSVDGVDMAEGYASGKADRLAWPVPAIDGVHSAVAEVFPFKPPEGRIVPPQSRAVARVPVSRAAASPDPWAGFDTWSLLAFDGNFADSGVRAVLEAPTAVGSPYLETYETGFGFALGDGDGVESAASLLPTDPESGSPAEFAIVAVTAPIRGEPGDGTIFKSASADGAVVFAAGVAGGIPYAESKGVKAYADQALPGGASRLALRVRGSDSYAIVDFFIDEKPAGSGRLPSALFDAPPGASTIAGKGGYAAVYDEFRVLRGAYPAYAAARSMEAGAAFIAASGFEGGGLGSGLALSGAGAIAGDGSLALEKGAVLIVGADGLPREGATLTIGLRSGTIVASLTLSDGSAISVDSEGNVSIGPISLDEKLDVGGAGLLSLSFKAAADGLDLYGADGSSIKIPSVALEGSGWRVSSPSDERAVISTVLATRFVQPQPSVGKSSAPTGDSPGKVEAVTLARAVSFD